MRDDLDDSKAPLIAHLSELRRRLLWSFAALGVAFALCFANARALLGILIRPLAAAGQPKLVYTQLYEAFFVEIKVAFFAAVMFALPVIANQIWLFVAPGLYRRERGALLPFLLATPVLFCAGAAMAYFIAIPTAIRFLLSFQGPVGGVEQQALPSAAAYLSFVMQFLLAFGVSFLLPVLLMLLARTGIVTRDQLVAGRRYAIVGAFAVAAVLTPPDIGSQLLLAIPLILLYELSLVAIWLTQRRTSSRLAEAETA